MGPLGLEPRTNGLKVRCSNQLSYGPTEIVPHELRSATDRGRTAQRGGRGGVRDVIWHCPTAEMPERGLEPPPSYLDKNLNLARLPIPPLGQSGAGEGEGLPDGF